MLVPRHPERFDAVFLLCQQRGWQVWRRSANTDPMPGDDILLADITQSCYAARKVIAHDQTQGCHARYFKRVRP